MTRSPGLRSGKQGQAEAQLQRVNRALKVLSECSRILVRAQDESELLQEVCQIIVGTGGYRLAWVGFAEEDEAKSVRPVAQRGYEEGYLNTVNISWADTDQGRGPTGTAIRTGKPSMARDILSDPHFAPWRPEAVKRGFASSLALPLTEPGKILGALNVYAAEPDAYDAEELSLLTQLAEDLSFGIVSLRTRVDRQRAEEALAERTRHLETVQAVSAELIRELDLPTLLGLIIRRAAEFVGAEAGAVYLWEEGGEALVPRAWHGLGEWVEKLRLRPGEGVAGSVAQRREGMIVNDFQTSAYAHPFILAHSGLTAVLAEPLLYRDRLVGVITIGRKEPGRAFTERDRALLALSAAPAAIAVENARLFAAFERAARQAQSLYEIAHTLATSLDPAELLQLVAVKTTGLLGTSHAQVVLWDEVTQALTLGAAHGTEAGKVQTQVFRLGEGVNGIVAQTRAPLIVNDYQGSPHRMPGLTEVVAVIGVPLLYRDRFLGVLTSHATQPGWVFTAEHLALLTSFADHAAIALENARLYREVQQHAARLEARVEERTRELVAANQAHEKASRHKSEFLANMSHELRTPLNSVIGFAEVLLGQGTGPLTEKQTRFLGHIRQAGKHLLQLISDILDLSKVEAGKLTLQLEALPVQHVLDEVLVIVRGLAQQKAQTVEAEIEPGLPPLRADPFRLKQILFNLLSNAVKFTPEQGRITLGACRVNGTSPIGIRPSQPGPVVAQPNDSAGEWLELRVTDTGTGIAPEDLPRLFQEFVQLETTATKRQEGTGLGLALTKRLVELHGGQISAESRGPGCGACFVVRLPYLAPPPPKRILVVEDQAPVLEALCAALQTAGHAVDPAQTGAQALSVLAAALPDLLVLDIGLPDVDGWTILGQLRSAEATRVLPVLVLTGLDQVRADQALALGADEFLAKPVSPRVLLETAARLLARSARKKGTPG